MFSNNLKIKFGLGAIFRNPLRLIGAMLTSIVTMCIAGLCAFTYSYSAIEWEKDIFLNYLDDPYINIVVSSGSSTEFAGNIIDIEDDFTSAKYAEIRDKVTELGGNYATMIWGQNVNPINTSFSIYELNGYLGKNEEIDNGESKETVYHEYNGEKILAPYVSVSQDYRNSSLYWAFFEAMTVYSSEAALDDFGYTIVGKLPEEYNEVAIPQWLYNSFLCYGYRNPDVGEEIKISSNDDIIGKTIKLVGDWKNNERRIVEATIVGVVHSDTENEKSFLDIDYEKNGKFRQLSTDYSLPPQVGLAVSQKFLNSYHTAKNTERYVNCVTVSRTTGLAEKYFDYITAWKADDTFMNVWSNGDSKITYAMPECIRMIYMGLPHVFESTTIYFKIIPFIIPLAVGVLAYFTISTVYGRKREMGILRSLGTSNFKIWLTYMLLFILVAAVISCAALGAELIFLKYMNNILLSEANYINAGLSVRFYPFALTSEAWLFTFLAPVLVVTLSLAVVMLVLSRRSICALTAK